MRYFVFILFIILISVTFSFFMQSKSKINNELKEDDSMNNSISKITVKDIDGNELSLSEYKGKVLLIVNVASYCGYTKQYSGLEELYRNYKEQGFVILAFPCNDFGSQEPGTNEEIKEFCSSKYDVTFPLFDKISVLGENKHPLYQILTNNDVTGNEEVKWNFEKFLISKTGNVVAKYKSKVDPLSEEIISAVENELKK